MSIASPHHPESLPQAAPPRLTAAELIAAANGRLNDDEPEQAGLRPLPEEVACADPLLVCRQLAQLAKAAKGSTGQGT